MIKISHEIERRRDGIIIYRHYFLYNKAVDWCNITHKWFTEDERKIARFQHKEYLKSNK